MKTQIPHSDILPKVASRNDWVASIFDGGIFMKEIPLTQGKVALIDDDMFDRVSYFKWSADKSGKNYYARTNIGVDGKEKSFKIHQLLLGFPKNCDIDHINGDGLLNTKDNLRLCSHSENCRNSSLKINNVSGFRGVHWHKNNKKWVAQINKNGKRVNLGYFINIEDAVIVFNKASKEIYKEFSRV